MTFSFVLQNAVDPELEARLVVLYIHAATV